MRSLVILSFAALAACGDMAGGGEEVGPDPMPIEPLYSDADLIGNWSCITKTADGSGTADVDYASGGRSSAQIEMDTKVDGAAVKIVATGSGTWELAVDQITEELTKFTVVGATADGRRVRDKELVSKFEEAMEGQVSTSTIKTLDAETLVATTGDAATTCTR